MELNLKENWKKYVTIAIVLAVVISGLVYVFSLNGNSFDFSDTQIKIVISGSMDGEPREQYEIETIPVGSAVFVSKVPSEYDEKEQFYSSLKVGDVLTFNFKNPVTYENMVVTHRIIDIKETNGVYTYTLAGDSIRDDPTNSSTQIVTSDSGDVIGKVTGVSYAIGWLITFLSTWYGKVIVILIPCVLLIISESKNIYDILTGKKKIEDSEKSDSKTVSEFSESEQSDKEDIQSETDEINKKEAD